MAAQPMERGKLVDSAQDVAERAGAYVQAGMTRASRRARDLAQDASERVEGLTGKSVESWVDDLRSFVRDRPVQAILGMVAFGYILGKVLTRRSAR
jgi:ElaB/YqjD/DUF883 family membrane-anchored ribosome-binding protein